MLSFDASLSNALKLKNTTAFWVCKLYYNAEGSGDFIGVSDIDRSDGSDMYYGLVSSWGQYSQSLDFFNFTTTTANISIRLINTERSIKGGRFSDLFSSNNFANRKWELFLNTNQAGTFDTAARMIGTGIISGDIQYDYTSVKFTLIDLSSKKHKRLPKTTLTSASYANAPEKNIGKPVPIAYGDFATKANIGTIPSSPKFDYFFTKGKFPAIITNTLNEADGYVYAKVDNETMHTLNSKNIYIYNSGHYIACDNSNTALSNPSLKYKGTSWFLFVPISTESNVSNWVDGSFSTSTTLSESTGTENRDISIPEVPNLGVVSRVDVIFDYGTIDMNNAEEYSVFGVDALNSGSLNTTVQIQSGDGWDFAQSGHLQIRTTPEAGAIEVNIKEMGGFVTLSPSKTLTKRIDDLIEYRTVEYDQIEEGDIPSETFVIKTERVVSIPADIDYVYCSGKGRKYGAWIDTINSSARTNGNGNEPDPNYAANDLIENPVYIIEDILRTEMGLDGSTTGEDIDIESFDRSGNGQTDSSKGDIAFTLNDAIADIKFAFSQYKFINSKDLINQICKQICSWVWLSGDGKFKIRTLLRPGDTFSADKTIDFLDINLKSISKTKLSTVRNDITVNYNYDYGQEQNLSQVNTTDSTSQGTTVDGNNQTLKLVIDALGTLDSTTATQIADAYKAIFKDTKIILEFDILTPKYNDLEITDHITFSNWDSNLKLYGAAFSSDYFLITSISKKITGCSIKAIKVDA
tara:strand:- start:9407 stop:11650 length:2244 start_codon:yes stop_codon:yes gene_type:complete